MKCLSGTCAFGRQRDNPHHYPHVACLPGRFLFGKPVKDPDNHWLIPRKEDNTYLYTAHTLWQSYTAKYCVVWSSSIRKQEKWGDRSLGTDITDTDTDAERKTRVDSKTTKYSVHYFELPQTRTNILIPFLLRTLRAIPRPHQTYQAFVSKWGSVLYFVVYKGSIH